MTLSFHFCDDPGDSYDSVVVCVTDYEAGRYEGSGWALVLAKDGRVELYNLSHCSCYGPWDEEAMQSWKDLDAFREAQSNVLEYVDAKLAEKFLELCRWVG